MRYVSSSFWFAVGAALMIDHYQYLGTALLIRSFLVWTR